MTFGIRNAPATFERLMETVLRSFTYESYLVYLDDVIMIGRTFQEHLLRLRKVFRRFREARLKLNPDKCQLFQKEVRYLRHIVSPERINTNPEKLNALRKWPSPKNWPEIRSFLDLCTYYRRFISGFANIANPLIRLTGKMQAFHWTPEVEAAFKTLCSARILAYPKPKRGSSLTQTRVSTGRKGASSSLLQ
jgi:hypothetical protein